MGRPRKIISGYFLSSILFVFIVISASTHAETVPSIPVITPATVPATITIGQCPVGQVIIPPGFYSAGACGIENYWPGRYLNLANPPATASCPDGFKLSSFVTMYAPPNSAVYFEGWCTSLAKFQCPDVSPNQRPFTLDPSEQTCSRPDQCQHPDAFDSATGQCVKCPIEALKPLPQDACTLALENLSSTQAQKDAACGKLSQAMEDGKACLEKKLSSLGTTIPLSVGVGVRSDGYQKHFVDIWNQMEKIAKLEDPIMQAACAARRAEIAAEKGCDNAGRCESCFPSSASQRSHCLKGRPSSSNTAPHTMGNAIDVSESRTIKPLRQFLLARKPPQNIQQFLDEPPEDCKLKWGGTFTDNYDPIHFQVR